MGSMSCFSLHPISNIASLLCTCISVCNPTKKMGYTCCMQSSLPCLQCMCSFQVAGEKSVIRREEGDGGPADHLSLRPVARREGEGEGRGSGDRLAEERLKWLMEMENLRRECEQRQESERNRCAEEVRVLRGRVGVLEEKCRVMTGEVEEGRMAKTELNQARERLALH